MVRKLLLIFLVLAFSSKIALSSPPPLVVQEEDGSPKKIYPTAIKFPNGNVTVNGDGTVSIADNTSVGGGNSVYLEHDGSAVGNNASSDITLDGTGGIDLTCVGQDCTIAGESASDTNAGIVELATTAETATGTDATRAVTPDGLHDMTTLSGAAWFLDEDDFVSDSATKTVSQQSAKAYIASYAQPLEATLTDIADGTIAENLVNTANPWADNEVADTITASNYLPLAGGTMTGKLTIDETGIEGQPTDALTDCSTFSATGGGIFYDDSEGQWKKCEDNVLSDLDTGGGGGDSISIDSVGVTDPDFVSTGDIDFVDTSNTVTANIGNDKVTEAKLKAVDAASDEDVFTYESTTGDFEWHSRDEIVGGISAGALPNDSILEADLKAVDSATDEDILTYESTTGDFEWHTIDQMIASMSAGGLPNDSILEADLKAVDAASDEECLTYETTTGDFEWQTCGSGSDTNAVKEYWWPASATLPLEAADSIPPISKDTGTNVDQLAVLFDSATDECRSVTFKVPSDVESGSTITFRALWYSTATSGDVMWDFRHTSGDTEGESWDDSLTTEAAAADTVQGTTKLITVTTWTETLTNLGWAANDLVTGVFCRDANNGSDTMAADAYAIGFGVEIPRA